jgi:hypothetical protein
MPNGILIKLEVNGKKYITTVSVPNKHTQFVLVLAYTTN